MFEKLQTDYQRFLDIERALLDPEITADARKVRELSKERGALAKIAFSYGRYLDLGRQISEAEEVCDKESDAEMRSYAEAELTALKKKQEEEGEGPRATCSMIEKRGPCTRQ